MAENHQILGDTSSKVFFSITFQICKASFFLYLSFKGVVGSSSGLGILGVGLPRKNFQLPPQSPGMETGDIFLELREKRPAMG